MAFNLKHIIQPSEKYKDVRNINIYLLRGLFFLMAFVLGYEVWSYILGHSGAWNSDNAVVYCVLAGFTVLSLLGIINPIKMLPLLLLEIFYKVLWLMLVAYPLWSTDQIAGSPIEKRVFSFSLVTLAIIAMPWGYAFKTYIKNLKAA
jgi:hypothetical protein